MKIFPPPIKNPIVTARNFVETVWSNWFESVKSHTHDTLTSDANEIFLPNGWKLVLGDSSKRWYRWNGITWVDMGA